MLVEFAARLERHGEAPALVTPGRPPLSYAALARRADAIARDLVGPKRLVAIVAAPSEHAVIAYLGALRAGHAVALLPPCDEAALESFATRFRPDWTHRRADGRWRWDEAAEPGPEPHRDLALIMLTSGSTGHGKAVRLSAEAVSANAASIVQLLELRPADRGVALLPLHYSYGLSVLHAHLAAGGSLVLGPRSILDPDFVETLAAGRITNLAGVPHSYDLLESIRFRDAVLPDLRVMTAAGGRLAPERARLYAQHLAARDGRFYVMYGQTEATARIAYVPPASVLRHADCIGIAVPGGALKLVDDKGRDVEAGEGELAYRGPNVMMGYAETRADLRRGAELDWLRTGDLAEREPNGFYRITGRLARFSKIGGVRVGHDAVEAALAAQGIDASVTGGDRGLVAAYASPEPPAAVAARLAEVARLATSQVRAVRLGALPRLASGKVDHAAVRALVADAPERTTSDNTAFLRDIGGIFFPQRARPTDSFAALGGDSLRHVEMTLLLERRLGHAPAGWERMTFAALGHFSSAGQGTSGIATDLVIRACAILLIVVHHETLWTIPGGAAAMMVLVGFSLARFSRDDLVAGAWLRVLRPLATVLVPYWIIVAGYALAWGQVPWASVLLVGNFGFADPVRHTMVPYLYWFVEAFAQIILLCSGLFLIPAVRRLGARDPFRLGLMLLAGALAARIAIPPLIDIGNRQIFTPWWVMHLVAFGWCAALADTARRRALVLGVAAAVMPAMACLGGNWLGSWVIYTLQIGVIGLLLYVPRIRLPKPLIALALPVAAASFSIYLVHRLVPEMLLAGMAESLDPTLSGVISIAGGIAAGLFVAAALRTVPRMASAAGAVLGTRAGRSQAAE